MDSDTLYTVGAVTASASLLGLHYWGIYKARCEGYQQGAINHHNLIHRQLEISVRDKSLTIKPPMECHKQPHKVTRDY